MSDNDRSGQDLMQALAAPFLDSEIKFKPQVVQGDRALALAYVDARTVQDRLDDVLGTENWQDEYECLPDGSVICRLKLRLGGEWVQKMDVGSPSEQPDSGDRMKAAFSDALKRAAVKFGVARYLHKAASQWVGYNPQKKQFTSRPTPPQPNVTQQQQRAAAQEQPKASAPAIPPSTPAPPPPATPAKAVARGPAKNGAPAQPATAEQFARIDELCIKLRHDLKWLTRALDLAFHKKELAELNYAEAARVLFGLEKEWAAKTHAEVQAAAGQTPAAAAAPVPDGF